MELFDIGPGGIVREVRAPSYGRQDIGFSPGGPLDCFAMRCGNILLDNEPFAPALEIIVAPPIAVLRDCLLALTGAGRADAVLHIPDGGRGTSVPLRQGVVTLVRAGCRLDLGEATYGFRTYLCARACDGTQVQRLIGRVRPPFAQIGSWTDPEGRIRVLSGPECSLLRNPSAFLVQPWQTTRAMSDMGIRLAAVGGFAARTKSFAMVSQPVNDGTVQLTPDGPIILLRARQTIGGYPRVFNVIGPDVDVLAQYGPGQMLRFRLVTVADARAATVRQTHELRSLCQRFNT